MHLALRGIVLLLSLAFTSTLFAQTTFKKISKESIKSFSLGEAPLKCVSSRSTETATQIIFIELVDGTNIQFPVEGIDTESWSGDYTDYASCADAKARLKSSVEVHLLRLFSIQSGDMKTVVSEGKVFCTVQQLNTMIEGDMVRRYEEITVPTKCSF